MGVVVTTVDDGSKSTDGDSKQMQRSNFEKFKAEVGVHWLLICFTNFFAFIFSLVIVFLCLKFAELSARQPFEFLLVCLLGALIGWVFGMFFVPYTTADKKRFSNVAGAVSAFVSGYALSATNDLLKEIMRRLIQADSVVWLMIGLFVCSFVLVFLTVFSNRSYHGVNA